MVLLFLSCYCSKNGKKIWLKFFIYYHEQSSVCRFQRIFFVLDSLSFEFMSWSIAKKSNGSFVFYSVCPGSSDPFYIVSYYIKLVTTSWTHSSIDNLSMLQGWSASVYAQQGYWRVLGSSPREGLRQVS